MNFFNKLKDRYNFLILVLVLLMAILSLRLAILTIAKGDYYRDIADNKRIREVETTAQRGEIRDRNGKLLAGNMPSFTVQLFKDELTRYDSTTKKSEKNLKKNAAFLELIRLLEEDGVQYVDEYPLEINTFAFRNESDYELEGKNPLDKVIDIIMENDLVIDILGSYYKGNYEDHFQYIPANRAIYAFKKKGIEVPIVFEIGEEGLIAKYDESKDIDDWILENEISPDASPLQALRKIIGDDDTIVRNMVDHPITRIFAYNILVNNGLESNIVLEEYSITYEEDYISQKRILSRTYPEVTEESTALEDFTNIFYTESLREFLGNSYKTGKNNSDLFVPAKLLIEMMEERRIDVPIKVKIAKDKESFEFINTDDIDRTYEEIIELLADYSYRSHTLKYFLDDASVRPYAQSQLLSNGVNPKISVSSDELEYVAMNNLKKFYSDNEIKEEEAKDLSKEEILDKIVERYNIDRSLSKYELLPILNVYDQVKKQGYLAYQPINIAYGIKDSTVAQIEEAMMEVPGIQVSLESVRYYPEGETAAHVLGYLGKISQQNEIEKYVEEKGYAKNAIIGKTGIEESMEEKLAGVSGRKRVEVDSVGNTITTIESETKKPIPGDNVYLSIDLNLQKKTEEILKNGLEAIQVGGVYESPWGNFQMATNRGRPYSNATTGAIVALDVKTGQVLSMASYPAYNPNLFSTGISSTDWSNLFPENEDDMLAPRPLYNIATQTAVQPGSVYKMATGLTALDKGLSPHTKIYDGGFVNIGEKRFACLKWTLSGGSHGAVDITTALQDSCNYYFYSLGMGRDQKRNIPLNVKIDIDDITEMSRKLGLDDRTGIEINIPSETYGGVPNPDKKIKTTKAILKNFLRLNIDDYMADGKILDEEEKEIIVEEISSWVEKDEIMTRNQVIDGLIELGVDPDAKVNAYEGIADRIKYTYIDYAGWNITDTLNVTIGQGSGAYTPIQIANYVSTIVNGGFRNKLSLLDSIRNYNNSETIYSHEPESERIELNNYDNLEYLKEGMHLVSTVGTAAGSYRNFPVKVGVKTGTAENKSINPVTGQKYDDFSWFVGFGPYDDPEIAVVSLIFQGGSGMNGGPLVRDVMAEYLGLNIENEETKDKLPYENSLTR